LNTLDTIRTDNVGSLLRPAAWKEARVRMDGGLISAEEFHAIEMDCIRKAVAMQEGAGMEVITDGEISRLNFQDSFGLSVGGYDTPKQDILKLHEKRAEGAKAMARWDIPDLDGQGTPVSHRRPVLERIFLARNVPVEEYKRVAPLATKPVKVSLVGPDRVAQRFDHQKSKAIYTDQDAFMADLVALQRKIISGLVEAGCRYVHIDEPGYTAYVDKQSLDIMRARRRPAGQFRAFAQGQRRNHQGLSRRDLRCARVPRQPGEHVASRGHLRRHRRAHVQRTALQPLFARIRLRARRQF
jgi:5-methyltetrahydropteroyltriglutamate--homocysteine methyltransferase